MSISTWMYAQRRMSELRPAANIATRRSNDAEPLLTVIIPVFNEVKTISEVVQRVLAAPYRKQVIIVDDGSNDGTERLIKGWVGHPEMELLAHFENRGRGAAIRTALNFARGRFTILQDADLEYDPREFPRLIEPLLSGESQVVYGARDLSQDSFQSLQRHAFGVGVNVLNVFIRLLYGVKLSDEATCYKVFPTAALKAMDLQCERFEFCPEVTAKAIRLGLTILEVPIRYRPRSVRDGKKIRWRDGWYALKTLWLYRQWTARSGSSVGVFGISPLDGAASKS